MAQVADSPSRSSRRPLRRDAEMNRVKILAAAGEVFARDGLDVAMEQIADHAGVGIATMYRRFPSKEILIEALFQDRINRVATAAEEALECEDAWAGLVTFMEKAQSLFAADRGLVDAVFEPAARGPEGLCAARARLAPLSEKLVRRAQEQGKLRDDLDPTDLPMLQLMLSMVVRFTGEIAPDVWARYLGIILDGLRVQRRRPIRLPAPPLRRDQLDAALANGISGGRRGSGS